MADFSHTGLLLFGKHCPLTFLLFWACFFFSIWANIRSASVVVLWLKQKTIQKKAISKLALSSLLARHSSVYGSWP